MPAGECVVIRRDRVLKLGISVVRPTALASLPDLQNGDVGRWSVMAKGY